MTAVQWYRQPACLFELALCEQDSAVYPLRYEHKQLLADESAVDSILLIHSCWLRKYRCKCCNGAACQPKVSLTSICMRQRSSSHAHQEDHFALHATALQHLHRPCTPHSALSDVFQSTLYTTMKCCGLLGLLAAAQTATRCSS
jgi:hypothetical protein